MEHILLADGVKTDPKKVHDVLNFCRPCNVNGVQTFTSMTHYYVKFIQNFNGIAAPLMKLMRKRVKFHWTPEHQEALEILKKKLPETPVLAYPIEN